MTITYHIDLTRDPDQDPDDHRYTVTVRELPGCISEAETIAEALTRIGDVMVSWVDVAEESGIGIPSPEAER